MTPDERLLEGGLESSYKDWLAWLNERSMGSLYSTDQEQPIEESEDETSE